MRIKTLKAKTFVFLFLLPAILIYTLFQIIPLIGAVYFSFSDWNGIGGTKIKFVGIKNYIDMFKDKNLVISLKNMLFMVFGSVLFHTPLALILAVALQSTKRGFRILKAIYFVPTVFPMTAIGLMWYFIFMPNGSFNSLLKGIGLDSLTSAWLVNSATAMPTITAVNVWAGVGYYLIIILAGLTMIPSEIYEAAALDGVGPLSRLIYIIVPMIRSTLVLCITMDVMGTIKVFDLVFSMTEGGPNGMTNLPTTLMYQQAFRYDHYGIGSAIGIVILIICLIMTRFTTILNKKSED